MTLPWVRGAGALALGILLATATAGPVRAAPAAPDTAVTTRDGAAYQGVLVEQIPGDHVTIQTADGKIHTFAASQVVSVRPLGPHAAVEPIVRVTGSGGGVLVDLATTDPNARLVQLFVSGGAPAAANPEICGPPCGVAVPPGTYVVGGAGIVPSAPFSLLETPQHVRVTSDPVTIHHRDSSIILAAGGGIGAVSVGLPLWLSGVLIESAENDQSTFNSSSSTPHIGTVVKWTGLVLTGACLAAALVGLVTYQSETTARVDPAGP
jgi:hypothetical protein